MLKRLVDVDVKDKVILVRADFNVPIRNGMIAEDSRIRKTMPTIHHLLDEGAKQVIILTHFGRPKGEVNDKYRVIPIYHQLKELLPETKVGYADDCLVDPLPTERVVLLENTRFYPEEKKNDDVFAKKLAHGADVFVFDAFGTAHRDHASTIGVAKYIPERCIGLLMEKELRVLQLREIPKPFKAIIGAAKVSDKIPVLESLLPRVDKLLLGGAIVFTFLKALGYEVGNSLVEESELSRAKRIYEEHKDKIILPVDVVVTHEDGSEIYTVDVDKIPKDMKGLDVGDATIELFEKSLENAGTIFWNGPLGMFEMPPFDHATKEIAHYLSKSKKITIVGGGDTEEAIIDAGVAANFTHISTGGGAALELIAGHKLVVVEKLEELG